jgi:L-asparaginase II
MQANPILAETVRGNWVENRYRGAIAVVDASGKVIAAAGDIERPIFPRSAIKAMQALPIFTSGAIDRFALSEEQLALACASHHGENVHVATAAGFLDRAGLGAGDLECGAHLPTNPEARQALRESGNAPSPLHNNCSGKHAGMLSVAVALGTDPHGYVEPGHQVQRQVREAIEAVIGEALHEDRCGTDGCSIPTYAAPLRAFAAGFARMATGEGLSPDHAAGARRLFDAATAHPHLVAGSGHADTRIMGAFGGRVMQKVGAEAVQCGAIRDKGWGYAIKCDDGNVPASQAMLAALLLALAEPGAEAAEVLNGLRNQPIRNVRGRVVGALRAVDPFPIAR